MTRTLTALLAVLILACAPDQTQPSPTPTGTVGGREASPSPTGSPAGAPSVDIRVVQPEDGETVGTEDGTDWSVSLLVTQRGEAATTSPSPTALPTGSPTTSPTGSPTGSPTASPTGSPVASPTRTPSRSPAPGGRDLGAIARPTFQPDGQPGRNPAFPGLVVLLSTTEERDGLDGPETNLAGLFQIIALGDTEGQLEFEAVWMVLEPNFGAGVEAELTVFVVEGDAPDVVTDREDLRIISNEVTVRFRIGGDARGASPSPTRSPTASPTATGTASPTASPTGSPTGSPSPSPTRSP